MKKIILTTVAILTFGFISAQDNKEMSFGVKGGLNVSTLANADGDGVSVSSLVGFHIGGFAEFMITDKFAVQPEVLYSAQGAKFDDGGDKGDWKLNYIVVPVMAKYYVMDTFSLELGPQIGFLATSDIESGGISLDVKDETKSTDVSLCFGAGYVFAENFMLGARYNVGLTQVQKNLEPGESEIKNSVFQISFGYKF